MGRCRQACAAIWWSAVRSSRRSSPPGAARKCHLMPGTVLVREWDEREYRVTVTADGLYELNGQRFKSLSAAARHITGTQWSGPKFFGLKSGKGGKR